MSAQTLLDIKNLKVHFPVKGGVLGRTIDHVKAVDDVSSFSVQKNTKNGWIGRREWEW